MKLILDEGLPLRAASLMRDVGIEAVHVLEIGMGGAPDQALLDKARLDGAVVVTLDADFHQLLAATGADRPSVIRVRTEGLGDRHLAELLSNVMKRRGVELDAGAVVSVIGNRVRLRKLPIRG
jgi:predicted nuclease of predicted toxin-antitoxin system